MSGTHRVQDSRNRLVGGEHPCRGHAGAVNVPEFAEVIVALHQADQVLDAGVQVVQVLLGAPGRDSSEM